MERQATAQRAGGRVASQGEAADTAPARRNELAVASHEVKTLRPGREVYVQQGEIFIQSDPQKALAFLEWKRKETEKRSK